jgi:hypothetical protein
MADSSNHPVIYSIDQWIDIIVGSEQIVKGSFMALAISSKFLTLTLGGD